MINLVYYSIISGKLADIDLCFVWDIWIMAVDLKIIQELEGRVGVEGQPVAYEIEKGMIKRFALAVGDPNPLWQDEEYAAKTEYGGIVAPPSFILTLGFGHVLGGYISNPSLTVLHGSTELDSYQAVRPGDVISVTITVRSVRQREGKTGKMLFVIFDMVYRNQRKETVAKCRQMAIVY
jgi:acyl dehydratase